MPDLIRDFETGTELHPAPETVDTLYDLGLIYPCPECRCWHLATGGDWREVESLAA